MKNRKEEKKKTKKNIYIIIAVVVICMFGLSITNQQNDGELNDYEIYEPLVVEDEEIEVNEGEVLEEDIEGLLTLFIMMTITAVIFSTIILPVFNSIRIDSLY